MFRNAIFGFAIVCTLAFLPACGNSEADCQTVCDWWVGYCFAETHESCMSDCLDTDESAAEAIDRCVDGQGWGTPSSCVSASCCVRFVYWPYQYEQQCL